MLYTSRFNNIFQLLSVMIVNNLDIFLYVNLKLKF